MKQIVWLASYPKSGNTWVRMFLQAYMTRSPVNINSAYQFCRRDTDAAILQMMSPSPVNQLSHPEQFLYRPGLLLNLVKFTPTKRTYLKTHNARVNLDGMPAIPLGLSYKAIYLVRDPRDVAISLAEHTNCGLDDTIKNMNHKGYALEDDETGLVSVLTTWSQHVKSWTLDNKELLTLAIKYEDLLNDPTREFQYILEHLEMELPHHEERFAFALQESSFDKLKGYEEGNGFIEKPPHLPAFFREGKAGQWEEKLTSEQANTIAEQHNEVMRAFGYTRAIELATI